ncbi:MAG TPA: hypothetical protein P5519_11990 [Spirochaetia bacterium]|nr:hypothetical protein [Spirochaetia bacterium]
MKALTDKIIDLMIAYKEEHHNVIVKSSVESLIQKVKDLEEEAEFEEVARVMIKHLNNSTKYHPHYTAVINSTFAELSEGKILTGQVLDYVVD